MMNKAVFTLIVLFNSFVLCSQNDALIKSVRVVPEGKSRVSASSPATNSQSQVPANRANSPTIETEKKPVAQIEVYGQEELNRLNIYNNPNVKDPNLLSNFDAILRYVILFDFNSAKVRSEFFGTIKQLGQLLKANESLKLEIQGHTDNIGDEYVNLKFSERRANSVMRMLVKFGIDPERMRITGFGSTMPVEGNTNKNASQRAQNRRVVFKAISDKDLVKVSKIVSKSNDDISERDMRTLKNTITYEDSFDPFEVKWRYMYSVLFKHRSSKVGTEYFSLIKALANVLKTNECLILTVTAHTDSTSTQESNMRLSMKRSQAVWDMLAYNGVDRTRVEVVNYGENKPINNSENAAEIALNRRVAFAAGKSGCAMNLDSLITDELLKSHTTNIGNQRVVQADSKYMVQTASFKTEDLAILMSIRLKDFVPDNIYIIEDKGWYKVVVGYVNSYDEAMNVARLIQASGILSNPNNL